MGKEFGEAIKAILINVFKEDQLDGPMSKAFQKADLYSIDDFMFCDVDDVKQMTYEDDSGDVIPLPLVKQKILATVIEWGNSSEVKVRDDWINIGMEAIKRFKVNNVTKIESLPPTPPPSPTKLSPTVVSAPTNLVYEFKRGIRRSVSDYQTLKQDNSSLNTLKTNFCFCSNKATSAGVWAT